MVTDRKFSHFKRDVEPPRVKEIPQGGFCISAFLIISQSGHPGRVLMGRINKKAAWDHLGALDPGRVERHSKGLMLPSSALILGESPQDAAQRILKEQLGIGDQRLEGPHVFSEVYGPENHWDLQFLFLGDRNVAPAHPAWDELRYVDTSITKSNEMARGHQDILAHVGRWHG
jgi:ADP-ribose pyrophosphatase YjhB (NUDIX family)